MHADLSLTPESTGAGRPRLLIVDDQPSVVPVIERFAQRLGFDVDYRQSGQDALAALPALRPSVVMVDLRMPGLDGIDVLKAIRGAEPDCQVILMTGDASVDSAIEAVKAGALDYVSKPFDFDRLERLLAGVREAREDREHMLEADAEMAERIDFHGLIGRSREMQQLFGSIRRLAPHVRTVLVTGETGTGKELVAKAFYREGGRPDRRFITVNCSAVVETLFESELFGHVRGAFTGASDNKVGMFEHAHRGTLFLDEAGDLPLSLQPKLLRAVEYGDIQPDGSLETRHADVCGIPATNRDLRAEVAAGRFRSDLFYRLSTIEVHLPPLRERREDIPYLAAAFIKDSAARFSRAVTGLTAGAERLLQEAPWPGNIRELRNVIERACIVGSGGILTERDIANAMQPSRTTAAVPGPEPLQSAPESGLLSAAQRSQIRRAIQSAKGNKAAAAKLLGISRRSLYRWIDRLDVEL